MPPKRVTLKQIAEAAGVHPTTVSMALRNHPRIPEATRNRLKALAEKMGYVPDPMLSSLNAYRHEKAQKKFVGKIAWLNISLDPEWPKRTTFIREYYEGASQRAKSLGYELEVFNAHPQRIPTRRLQQILLSRSIQGIVIAPLQRHDREAINTLDLDWEKFCSITFGYTLDYPEINRVTTDHYHAVLEVLRNLNDLGCRRPGLFLSRENNARISRLWEAGYLIGMRTIFRSSALPVALFNKDENEADILTEWYRTHTPDAIIAQDYKSIREWLETAKIRVPQDCKVVLLEEDERGFPCMDQRNEEVGAKAISLLVGSLQRNEHGIPDPSSATLIEGVWRSGHLEG